MSDNRFSSGTPKSGDDRYGYFATPGAGAGSPFGGAPAAPPAGSQPRTPSPAGGQFGGGPAPTSASSSYPLVSANQFGGSAGAGPFGAPPGAANPFGVAGYGTGAAGSRRRGVRTAVLVLVALLVIGGGWFGYHAYERSRPVVLPLNLGGLPVTSNAAMMRGVAAAQNLLQSENPNVKLQVRAYGSDTNRILLAAAARGATNVNSDLATFGNNVGAGQPVGDSICATSPAAHVTVCERSTGDLTVLVASATRGAAADTASVAALVDEIWRQV